MHYIRLLTERELSETQMVSWFNTVVKFAPAGIVMADDEEQDEFMFIDKSEEGDISFSYDVHLTRNLTEAEAQWIVSAWEMRFEDDFEIETSNAYRSGDVETWEHPFEIEMEEDTYNNIKEVAAKFIHNRWVESKTLDGWRYATRMNIGEKSHPALRDWDSLHPRYRKYPTITKTECLEFYTKYKHLFK